MYQEQIQCFRTMTRNSTIIYERIRYTLHVDVCDPVLESIYFYCYMKKETTFINVIKGEQTLESYLDIQGFVQKKSTILGSYSNLLLSIKSWLLHLKSSLIYIHLIEISKI